MLSRRHRTLQGENKIHLSRMREKKKSSLRYTTWLTPKYSLDYCVCSCPQHAKGSRLGTRRHLRTYRDANFIQLILPTPRSSERSNYSKQAESLSFSGLAKSTPRMLIHWQLLAPRQPINSFLAADNNPSLGFMSRFHETITLLHWVRECRCPSGRPSGLPPCLWVLFDGNYGTPKSDRLSSA